MSAVAPDERRVDSRQLRTLVRLTLKQSLGPGTDASTGSKGHPLRQILFSMTTLGVMLSARAWRVADLPTYLVLLFAAVFVIVILAINPDSQDVQERRLEILASKPIAPRTLLSARTILLLVLAGLLAGCLGLVPMAVAVVHFGLAWPRALAAYLTLIAGCFAAAVLWLSVLMVSLRWIPLDRVRKTLQFLLVIAILAITATSLGWIPLGGEGGGLLSIAAWPGALLAPSSWFALFWLPDPGAGAAWRRAGAVVLVAAAGVISMRGVLHRHYANFAEQSAATTARVPRSALVWALERLMRVPVLGPLLLPPPVQAVASAVLLVTRREDISRAKILASQLLALGAFAVALTGAEHVVTVTLLTYLGFSSVADGLKVTRQSSLPAAGWIFAGSPIEPRQLVRGLAAALEMRFLALPVLLLAAIFFRRYPPGLAAVLALSYVLAARLVIVVGLLLWPAFPLSEEQHRAQSMLSYVVGFALSIAFAVGQTVLVVLHQGFGAVIVVLGAAGLVAMAAAAWGLTWGAASRLARLEYPS
ncbi:MAG TPA: hypothetical protein VGQ33_08380 [Vicinamibacteria bacterium]|nr:hypothetical protein [Vicinamibacteria bacterium]